MPLSCHFHATFMPGVWKQLMQMELAWIRHEYGMNMEWNSIRRKMMMIWMIYTNIHANFMPYMEIASIFMPISCPKHGGNHIHANFMPYIHATFMPMLHITRVIYIHAMFMPCSCHIHARYIYRCLEKNNLHGGTIFTLISCHTYMPHSCQCCISHGWYIFMPCSCHVHAIFMLGIFIVV